MTQSGKVYSQWNAPFAESPSLGNQDSLSQLKPILAFLFQDWWKVHITGLDFLPKSGPALIVGNSGSVLPWSALMLYQALASSNYHQRSFSILAELDWIKNEAFLTELLKIGFVPWSKDNARKCFSMGHIVAVFPEGVSGFCKPFAERNRTLSFDWTKLLPAVELNIPILPLATLGCDEAIPVFANLSGLARFLALPGYPITPFFPWLPFPANLLSLPIKWQMRLLKSRPYQSNDQRDELEKNAKQLALFIEGEVQAELNRLLRARAKKAI